MLYELCVSRNPIYQNLSFSLYIFFSDPIFLFVTGSFKGDSLSYLLVWLSYQTLWYCPLNHTCQAISGSTSGKVPPLAGDARDAG